MLFLVWLVSVARWALVKPIILILCRLVFVMGRLDLRILVFVLMILWMWARNHGSNLVTVWMSLLDMLWRIVCAIIWMWSRVCCASALVMVVVLGVLGMVILSKLVRLVFSDANVFCIDLWKVWLIVIASFMDFIVVVRCGSEFVNFSNVKWGIFVMI